MNFADLKDTAIGEKILTRFLKYLRVWTTSDSHKTETPSTAGQWDLAKILVNELRGLGLQDVTLTDHCYVIGRLPASPGRENAPVIGLMAHLDTAADVCGKDVSPIVTRAWDGQPIQQADGRKLDPADDPALATRIGYDIICSDGRTLLGADDKAGIAEIMTVTEFLISHPELEHGPLEIYFTPDEETGKGLAEFPLNSIAMKACYTLDSGGLGELETECFNAYQVDLEFSGQVIHIGHARGRLANAVAMAAYFTTLLPRSESPESTDGYYGYYCAMEIKGDLEKAYLKVFVRDFEQTGIERRLAALESFAKTVEAQFPGGQIKLKPKLMYLNMKRKIDAQAKVLDLLLKAADDLGLTPQLKPIRGGTDGARLTELGIPSPNIFTGGHNFHSRSEWVALSDMVAAVRLVLKLVAYWALETSV